MKTRIPLGAACLLLAVAGNASAIVIFPDPGSPPPLTSFLLDPDTFDGQTNLPSLVVGGDVVLLENGSSQAPSNWSDVLRFSNNPNVPASATDTTSTVFQFSDLEAGFAANFVLSSNVRFVQETTTGVGTEADITMYVASNHSLPVAGTNTYNIHSDAALSPELPDPGPEGVPEPSSLALLGLGGLGLAGYAWKRRKQMV
jgi:hypothetical protein